MVIELLTAAALALFVVGGFCLVNFYRHSDEKRRLNKVSLVMLIIVIIGLAALFAMAIVGRNSVMEKLRLPYMISSTLMILIGTDYFVFKIVRTLLPKSSALFLVLLGFLLCIIINGLIMIHPIRDLIEQYNNSPSYVPNLEMLHYVEIGSLPEMSDLP